MAGYPESNPDDTLIERLYADELPGDRQHQREARVVLRALLDEAAARISVLQGHLREIAAISKRAFEPDIEVICDLCCETTILNDPETETTDKQWLCGACGSWNDKPKEKGE